MYILINIILLIIGSIISNSYAALLLGFIALLFGNIMASIATKDTQCKIYYVFNVTFFIYILATILRNIDIIENIAIFNMGADEVHYFKESEYAINGSMDLLLHDLFNMEYKEEGLYYFFIKMLSYIAAQYFDGNNTFLQLLGTSVIGSYVSIFLYKILKFYKIENPESKTILFMSLSCLLPVSIIIHRDSMIAFLYSISLYLALVKRISLKNIIIQISIAIVTFFIREQNGLFIILIMCVPLYVQSKGMVWLRIILLIIALLLVPYVSFVLKNLEDTINYYNQYAIDNATNGLSSFIDRLPFGIKQIVEVIQGQFQPLPIWAKFPKIPTIISSGIGILWSVVSIFWFRIFLYSSLFTGKFYSKLPQDLFIWWLVFLIFIFLNSSNADPRRMVCMYPVCYLIFQYLKQNVVTSRQEKIYDKFFYSSVIMLMLLIAFLKFK